MYIQDETLVPFNPSLTWPSLLTVHLGRLVERNKWFCWHYSRAFLREYGLGCFSRLARQCDRTTSADITQSAITLKPLKGEVINIHHWGGIYQAAGEQLVLEVDVGSRENVQHEETNWYKLKQTDGGRLDQSVSKTAGVLLQLYQKYPPLDNRGTRDRDMDAKRSLLCVGREG